MFIVGHVNKDGAIAGPKVMEHIVDTVLYFSAPTVHLYLDLNDSDNVCSSEKELLEFLRTYHSPKPIDPGKLEKIKLLFKEMCSNK